MSATHNPNNPKLLLMLAITLTGIFAFIQVYSIQAILPLLIHDFHASEVQIGLAVGATVLGMAIMSPLMGVFSDTFGRKTFIVGSLVFLIIPTALMATVQSIYIMMLYRFLQGLAVPGLTVVVIAYLSEEFNGRIMARLMSLYVSATVLGGFCGRFILGHLSEFMSWRHAFYVMAVLNIIATIIVWKQLPTSRNFAPKPKISIAVGMLKGHLRNRHVLTACALGFCVLFSLMGCFTYINLYLAEKPYLLNNAQLANIFIAYLVGMLVTPFSVKLIDRFGSAYTVIFAVGLSMVGVLITLVSPLWIIIFALVLMACGVFITQSATINYIAGNVKEGRSLASGLYYMVYCAGGAAGASACGFFYQLAGWHGVVIALLVAQVLALIITIKGMLKVNTTNHHA